MASAKERKYSIPPPPVMTILADHPILRIEDADDSREPDRLELYPKLGSVLDILRHQHTRPPMSIAIYGSWGTGKSSAMRWLADQLHLWSKQETNKLNGHARVDTVWFDPWKYHSRDDVWRGLIAEIILKCIDVANLDGQNVGRRLKQAAKQFGRFLGRSFLHVLANTEIGVKAGKGVEVEGKISGEVFQEVFDEYNKTAHPEKAYLNEFESTLRQWVQDFYPQQANEGDCPRRLAVFIDDLDRCLPQVTLEVLEALKLYLNIPGLMFVVGLDRDVVDAVISKHYSEHGLADRKSGQYLDKMFQVEVDVPPTQARAKGFLAEQITAMDAASNGYWSKMLRGAVDNTSSNPDWYKEIIENKIERISEHNPREIKRLLNSTMLRAVAAARNNQLPGEEGLRFAQGAQVFLVQRIWKREFKAPAAMLLRDDVQSFFYSWSMHARRFPEFSAESHDSSMSANSVQEEGTERATLREFAVGRKGSAQAGSAEYEALKGMLPTFDGNLVQLLKSSDLRDLMVIPFSLEVACEVAMEAERRSKPNPMSIDREDKSGRAAPADSRDAILTPAIAEAAARTLEKAVDELALDDLKRVRTLDLSGSAISDLAQIKGFVDLENLDLRGCARVTDLSPLAGLAGLQELSLSGCAGVTDLSPLAGLAGLQELSLSGCAGVTDLSPLAGLAGLQVLRLSGCAGVTDLSPLAGLAGLQKLNLSGCAGVTDLSPLAGLAGLQELSLSGCAGVTDLSPLAGLAGLQELNLSGCAGVADLSMLSGLVGLQNIFLRDCAEVADLSPLTKLIRLQGLYMSRCLGVTELSPLAGLTELQRLDLEGCTGVTDLSPLAGLTGLRWLDLSARTGVTDLTPLARLARLAEIDLSPNHGLAIPKAIARKVRLVNRD